MGAVNVLVAGCDAPVYYQRTDAAGTPLAPAENAITEVTAKLDGTSVALSNDPEWDAEGLRYAIELLGAEVSAPGTLVLTWSGTDSDGRAFADRETFIVLADDSPDALLWHRVASFLRLEASDPTTLPLVMAAQAYISGAGVTRPDASDEEASAQYDLAVSLYVSLIASGGESKLEPAMTSILLQLRA